MTTHPPTQPVKVLFLSIVPSPYQRDLFARLAARPEVDIRVVYCERASPDSPWPEKALAPYESVLPGFYLSWGGSRFIVNRQLPEWENADVIVCNGYMTLAAQRLMRKCRGRKPVLFWGEKMIAASTGVKGAVQRWLAEPLKYLNGFVAIGQGAYADYARRFPGKELFSVPYYCDLEAFRVDPPDRPRTPPTILFCGQMIARKGLDLLVEAFARLHAEGLEAKLLLIGREEALPEILKQVPESVHPHIENAGFQAPEALPAFFRRADIFVLPSRYDGWGVVVNQAVGAGLPVIVSDAVGSGPDLVSDGENGFVFPSGDVGALTDRLRQFLKDPIFLAQAAQVSWRRGPDFHPCVGADKWVALLQTYKAG